MPYPLKPQHITHPHTSTNKERYNGTGSFIIDEIIQSGDIYPLVVSPSFLLSGLYVTVEFDLFRREHGARAS